MPYPILMLFCGPSEIRQYLGDVVGSIVLAEYLKGLGASGRLVTDPNELYNHGGPISIKFSSTQLA